MERFAILGLETQIGGGELLWFDLFSRGIDCCVLCQIFAALG